MSKSTLMIPIISPMYGVKLEIRR